MLFLTNKESAKKTLLATIAFLSYFLAISLHIHAISLFLADLGPQDLPPILVAVSVLLIGYSFFTASVSHRFSAAGTFLLSLGCFALVYLLLSLMPFNFTKVTLFLILSGFFYLFLEMSILNFSKSLLTPMEEKRVLPLVFGFSTVGLISGSLGAPYFARVHEATGIGILPGIGLLVIAGLVSVAKDQFRAEIHRSMARTAEESAAGNLGRSVRFVFRESPLFRIIAISILLVVGIKLLTEFKMETVIAHSLAPAQFSLTLGWVYFTESLLVTLLSWTLIERVLFRFGVANLLLLFPMTLIAVLGATVYFQFHYLAVIGYYLFFAVSYYSYFVIAGGQLFSLAPKAINQTVFFLIRGLLVGVGYLFYSLLMLVDTWDIRLEQTLNTGLIFILCVALIVMVWRLRKVYFQTLLVNLESEDDYLKTQSIELLAERSTRGEGEQHLSAMLFRPGLPDDLKIRVVRSLGEVRKVESLPNLLEMLRTDPNSKVKMAVLRAIDKILEHPRKLSDYPASQHLLFKTFEDLFLSDAPEFFKKEIILSLRHFDWQEAVRFLETHLSDPQPAMQAAILEALGRFHERGIIPFVKPFLEGRDLKLRGMAIVALWPFENMRPELIPLIRAILESPLPESVESGLHVIGAIGIPGHKAYALRHINHADEKIRTMAHLTLVRLGESRSLDPLIEVLLTWAREKKREPLEWVLGEILKFPAATRALLIKKIQRQKEAAVGHLVEALRISKFDFSAEIDTLT